MTTQSKAKIFLSEERGCSETGSFRSFSTFNFKKYFNEHKCPFNDLYVFNDDTIAGGKSVYIDIGESSYVLLLPVVGSLVYKIDQGNENIIHATQLTILHFPRPATIEFLNCYENELINFIQVWVKADISAIFNGDKLFTFNLDNNKNQLININGEHAGDQGFPVILIGKFTGRNEVLYKIKEQKDLFVFVIEGVFEVQGRLLHARDGLALWYDRENIEAEALSNEAILLLLEL